MAGKRCHPAITTLRVGRPFTTASETPILASMISERKNMYEI